MRMRLLATTRRPASSSILVIAPVRLRRVASGLMIEKVRVTAMGGSFETASGNLRAPLAGGRAGRKVGGAFPVPMLRRASIRRQVDLRRRAAGRRAASELLHPLATLEFVELTGDVLALVEQTPGLTRGGAAGIVEEQQGAFEVLRFRAPPAIGER